MHFISLLAQAIESKANASEVGGNPNGTTIIRIVAGVLALVCVVLIVLQRKKKASKEGLS